LIIPFGLISGLLSGYAKEQSNIWPELFSD